MRGGRRLWREREARLVKRTARSDGADLWRRFCILGMGGLYHAQVRRAQRHVEGALQAYGVGPERLAMGSMAALARAKSFCW